MEFQIIKIKRKKKKNSFFFFIKYNLLKIYFDNIAKKFYNRISDINYMFNIQNIQIRKWR